MIANCEYVAFAVNTLTDVFVNDKKTLLLPSYYCCITDQPQPTGP